jgi:acyl dehydratase
MGADIYFDDVVVGSEFTSGERLVTEQDLLAFADISGDHHPIHVDAAFAAASGFGRRIAHGPFGIAVALGLFGQFTMFSAAAIAMTDIKTWRFRAPVFIGDRLRLRLRIAGKSPSRSAGRGVIERDMALLKADGSVAQEGQMGLLMARRPAAPIRP